jgi:peptidoglycan/LPS O-acetylase OafA/YrhL
VGCQWSARCRNGHFAAFSRSWGSGNAAWRIGVFLQTGRVGLGSVAGMKYNPAMDGIRALAVLAVVLHHVNTPGFGGGYVGVDVFFVLSGFLITSLLKDRPIHLGQFYVRRLRRLYPALLTLLALYLATFPWFVRGHHVRDALAAGLYLSDYGLAFWNTPKILQHTWSLSVEEHFYLLWPFVVMALAKIRTRRFVVYLLAAAYLASTAYRIWSDVIIGMMETSFRFDTRTSGLILGALLAYLPELRSRWWALAVLPLGWLTWWVSGFAPRPIPTSAAELLAAALILWAMAGARVLAWKPLVYLGTISYGLYLYHYPVTWVLTHIWAAPWTQGLPITLLIALPLAHYSHRYIEQRFRSAPVEGVVEVAAVGVSTHADRTRSRGGAVGGGDLGDAVHVSG